MRNLSLFFCLLCCCELSAGQHLTPELLWELARVGQPVLSPDGNWAAFEVTSYTWQENKKNVDIWLLDVRGGQPRRLTTAESADRMPVWSHDGRALFFVSERTGMAQIFKIELSGGEAVQQSFFKDGGDLEHLLLSPDGRNFIFSREVKLDQTIADLYPDLPHAQARIYDDLKFRHWTSWHEGTYRHLFISDLNGEHAVDLMAGLKTDSPQKPFGGNDEVAFSPDGREICYTALIEGRPATSTDSGLYVAPLAGGARRCLTTGMAGYDTKPSYSPDGRYIAFLSMSTPGYESDRYRLMLYDRRDQSVRELTQGYDETVNDLAWLDADTLLFTGPLRGTVQFFTLNIRDARIHQLTTGRHNYGGFDVRAGRILAQRSTMERPYELHAIDSQTGESARLTAFNDSIFATLDLPIVEEQWVDASDGKKIHNWVIKPPNFDPSQKYPLIVYCQGGPQSMISQSFSYRWNFHLMAAQGYVVVAANRRGMPGFGRQWNDEILKDWGGQAMRDLLSSADAMLAKPYVERSKAALVGASFGGYAVFRLMGENSGPNKRFATMIAHAGIFNLESWYLGTEELFFPNRDLGGPFWASQAQKEVYTRNSAHQYLDRWRTPILVIHGQKDFRVPVTEGMQAFAAAKINGLESRFLYFPEEGHWVMGAQNGILWHRVFFDWLARYCKQP